MDDIESVVRVARQLGMKASEVLEVVQVDGGELTDGGQLVRTHDGQWTLVRDDGTTQPAEAPLVAERDSGVFVGERGPEEVTLASGGVVKPAPKRRGRS